MYFILFFKYQQNSEKILTKVLCCILIIAKKCDSLEIFFVFIFQKLRHAKLCLICLDVGKEGESKGRERGKKTKQNFVWISFNKVVLPVL